MSEIKTIIIGDIEYDLVPREKKEKKKVGRWKPEYGECYHTPYEYWTWTNDNIDYLSHDMWVVFKTEEERDEYVTCQKAIVRVNDRIDELNDGWVADWMDDTCKVYISYNIKDDEYSTEVYHWTIYQTQVKPCCTQLIAQKIISEMKDNLDLIFKK